MKKKFMVLLLATTMSFNVSSYAFAMSEGSNSYETMESGVTKTVLSINQNKIILWDDGDKVVVEQYDKGSNKLVERSTGNRKTGEIKSVGIEGKTQTFSASDVVSKSVSSKTYETSRAAASSFSYLGKVSAVNIKDRITKTMKVYESLSNKTQTTYTVKRYNGNLASFISSLVVGLGLEATMGGGLIPALVGAGVAVVTGKIIEITTSITLASLRYSCSYYGEDTKTGNKSKTYKNSGYKYVINSSDNSKFRGKVFYEGHTFDPKDFDGSYQVAQFLVQNLYGGSFEAIEY